VFVWWTGTVSSAAESISPRFFRRWFGRFLAAVQFLTRIPTPHWTPYAASDLAGSAAFFPLVGVLVASLSALGLWVLRSVVDFPPIVGAVAAVAIAVGFTGFFHEDAFADVCDAFGGYTPQRRREIMRDSRVGSFGATGIGLLIAGEVGLLANMSVERAAIALLCAHTVGRFASVLLTAWGTYVTDTESLAKPYADGITNGVLAFAAVSTFAVVAVSTNLVWAVGFGIASIVLALGARRFFRGWLGGVTGDCLGAVNKVAQLLSLCAATHPRFPIPFWR
jgi:adenosylcobinamide-GDP ribazoletransferase